MTVRVINGCDMGTNFSENWPLADCTVGHDGAGDSYPTSTPIRSGYKYMRTAWGSSAEFRIDLPSTFSGDTVWGGFWWRMEARPGTGKRGVWGLHRGGSTQTSGEPHNSTYSVFTLYSLGERSDWFVIHDGTDTQVGDPFIMREDQWYWVSFVCTATDSGNITVKIDGNTVVNNESGDFRASASAVGSSYQFYGYLNFSSANQLWDDFVFGDGAGSDNTGIPSPSLIQIIHPDGDDTNTGYTTLLPTTPVDRYSKINETGVYDDDTSYIDTAALSDEYTVTMDNVPVTTSDIWAFKTVHRARRSSGGDTVTLRPRIEISATYYNGTDTVTGDSYVNVVDIWEDNPADSNPFEDADINGLNVSGIMV